MSAALFALGLPSGWARLVPNAAIPAIWCTSWDSEGYGFLLLLIAIRLAVGLLPEPARRRQARLALRSEDPDADTEEPTRDPRPFSRVPRLTRPRREGYAGR